MQVSQEAQEILKGVGNGEYSAYDILSRPNGTAQLEASRVIEAAYASKCEGGRFHPDDDFEEILDAVCDDLQQDYA